MDCWWGVGISYLRINSDWLRSVSRAIDLRVGLFAFIGYKYLRNVKLSEVKDSRRERKDGFDE
jgi:hypothetical protein